MLNSILGLRYKNVDIWVSPMIVKRRDRKEQVVVDWTGGEGISHWLCKVAAVRELLAAGFKRGEIFLEHTVRLSDKQSLRADVFAQKQSDEGKLQTVWVECVNTEIEKMQQIKKMFPDCKLLRLTTPDHLDRMWFAKEDYLHIDSQLIPDSEIWAIYFGDSPRPVYGVRKLKEGYIFLDGDWSVRNHLELGQSKKVPVQQLWL